MITAKVQGLPELKAAIRKLQNEVKGALKEAALAGAQVIQAEAARQAARSNYPSDVGHLAEHIEVVVFRSTPNTCKVKIGPDEDHWYGRLVETGAGPHIIKASEGKLLAFKVDGQQVLAKEVNHPGSPAQPYLRPAMDTKGDKAIEKFGEVMKRRLT